MTKLRLVLALKMNELSSEGIEIEMRWAPQFWLVSFNGTTGDLSERIGLGDDYDLGSAIIMPVTTFAGYGPSEVWEWLGLHRDDA